MTVEEAIAVLGVTPHGVAEKLDAVPVGPRMWAEKTKLFHSIVKSARKMALRKWHPDVNKQAGALEMTQKINLVADQLLRLRLGPRRPPPPSRPAPTYYRDGFVHVVSYTWRGTGPWTRTTY